MGIKKDRYIEAYARIDSSIKSNHYFEAITIEESILSDRIASFLESTDSLKSEQIYRQGFSALISLWQVATSMPGAIWEPCSDLIAKVDGWRKQRNKYIHGLVKFPQKEAKITNTKDFIAGAEHTARIGKELAQDVSDWRRRQSYVKGRFTRNRKGQ